MAETIACRATGQREPRWQRLSRAIALVMINRNGEYKVERLVENTRAKVEQLVEKHGRENAAIYWRSILDEGGGRTRSRGR